MSARNDGATPGPWDHVGHGDIQGRERNGGSVHVASVYFRTVPGKTEANAKLIAAAPCLLGEIEREYAELAGIHNDWPGRDTLAGQQKLCRLRDLICKATGREAESVQDEYSMRTAITKAEQS